VNTEKLQVPGAATADRASPVLATVQGEPRRRRLVRGAAAGVGVFFAMQARTALGGGVCQSPSAMISGNTSPRPGDGTKCSGGRSPGFWKVPRHAQYWPAAGATFPTFKNTPVGECSTGMKKLSVGDIKTPGTLVTTVLPGAVVPANTGIWAVLAFPTEFQAGQLMRHLIAAWLNAGYFTSSAEKYPLTKQQVQEIWAAVKGGGVYCPSSLSNACGAKGMDAAAVVRYIEGMYDFNSTLESDICKPD
jgi:hypothetical protein